MKTSLLPLAFSLVALSANSVQAVVLAQWTFQTSVPTTAGPHAPENGVMGAASEASTNSGGTIGNPDGNGSTESFNSNNWAAGEYYQFTTSSTGYSSLTVSYAQAASSTGPGNFQFQYSTDGITYVPFMAAYAGPETDFSPSTANPDNVRTFNLSSITGLDNQPSIGFRIVVDGTVAENDGSILGGGTFRVDDFTINAVPEVSSAVLAGLGALGLITKRRRSRSR